MSESLAIIVAALGGAVMLRILIDYRHAREGRALHRATALYVRERYRPRTSILIELRRNADTILPLLDHLGERAGENEEIFVLIKQTAGTNAQPKLAQYRRKHGRKNLHLIKHRRGMSLDTLRLSHATGDFAIVLEPHERLSRGFFESARLAFLDQNICAATPLRQYQIGETLRSALRVAVTAWRQITGQLAPPTTAAPTLTPGVVYRRVAASGTKTHRLSNATIYDQRQSPSVVTTRTLRAPWIHVIFLGFLIALLVAAVHTVAIYRDTLALLWVSGLYLFVYIGIQYRIHTATWSQRVSVLMLAPFMLPYDLLAVFSQMFRPLLRWLRKAVQAINVFGILRTKRR